MINKLKARWGIESNIQVIIILLVFSLTGSAAVYVKKIIFTFLGINADTSLWIKVPMYAITIIPAYQLLLLVIGFLFGQFRFFYQFQQKSFSRFKRKNKSNN
jgi:ferrochelatase